MHNHVNSSTPLKTIFFVAYGGGHIKLVEHIAQTLMKEPGYRVLVLGLTTAYPSVKDKFPDTVLKKVSDYTFLFDECIDEVYKLGLQFLDENHTPGSGILKQESITYLGLSLYDLTQRLGYDAALQRYREKSRHAFLPITIIKKILAYEKADIVVATTSPKFEQASLIAGNELGLKTVEILDLFGELYPLPEAKHIICMNDDVIQSLKNQGLTNRLYYPFGQPAIEATVKSILSYDASQLKKNLQLKPRPTLLYASQRPTEYQENFSIGPFIGYSPYNDYIFDILDRLHVRFDLNVLLRIHPNESLSDFTPWLEKHPFIKVVNEHLNLQESLAVSDMVLTHSSTVGVESIASGKTVFTFSHHLEKNYPLPAATRPPFIFSRGFEALEEAMASYIQNPYPIEGHAFLPFNAVEKTVNLIKEL